MFNFNNLEEFHYWANCRFMNNEFELDSNRYLKNPLVVEIENLKYDLDLSNFGYGNKKMQMLRNKYINEEKLNIFLELVEENKRDCMFYFEDGKKNKDWFDGKMDRYKRHFCNCLLEIVYLKKQDKFVVVWRTTEFLCKVSSDFKLLNSILGKYNKKTTLVFLSGRQFKDALYGVFKLNGWKIPKPKTEKIKESVISYKNKYFSKNSQPSLWKETKVVQQKYFEKFGGKQNGI